MLQALDRPPDVQTRDDACQTSTSVGHQQLRMGLDAMSSLWSFEPAQTVA